MKTKNKNSSSIKVFAFFLLIKIAVEDFHISFQIHFGNNIQNNQK